jgi:hypothetical protein
MADPVMLSPAATFSPSLLGNETLKENIKLWYTVKTMEYKYLELQRKSSLLIGPDVV